MNMGQRTSSAAELNAGRQKQDDEAFLKAIKNQAEVIVPLPPKEERGELGDDKIHLTHLMSRMHGIFKGVAEITVKGVVHTVYVTGDLYCPWNFDDTRGEFEYPNTVVSLDRVRVISYHTSEQVADFVYNDHRRGVEPMTSMKGRDRGAMTEHLARSSK